MEQLLLAGMVVGAVTSLVLLFRIAWLLQGRSMRGPADFFDRKSQEEMARGRADLMNGQRHLL